MLLRALAGASLLALSSAHPNYLKGCAHPTGGLGPHAAPVEDSSITFAFHNAAGAVVAAPTGFAPGESYTFGSAAGTPLQAMVTVSEGALGNASLCDGRRLNLVEAQAQHVLTWTASADPGDVVAFAVTASTGEGYRTGGALLQLHGVRASTAAMQSAMKRARALPSAAGSGADGAVDHSGHDHSGHDHSGHDHSGSSDVMDALTSGMVDVQDLHVHLHVDDMHTHGGHTHGGGSWAGHVLPAGMFTVWGLWWLYNAVVGAATARATGQPFRSASWYPLRLGSSTRLLRLEPILKTALPALGIFCELYFHPGDCQWNSLYNPDGTFHESNGKFWQHAMMYSFFVLAGVVDLLFASSLPSGAGIAATALAFYMEAFLFWNHLATQSGLLAAIHVLLAQTIFATGLAVTVELFDRSSVIAAYARAFFTLLQASWFWQIASAIYGSKPWAPGMATDMALPVIFCQHVLGVALFMLVANHAYVVALGRMPGLAPAAATANGKHHLPPHHANGNGLPK